MAPLPPRPKNGPKVEPEVEPAVTNNSENHTKPLLERTQLEQQAGQEALKLSRQQHQEEVEAGMKMVELNRQRAK